MSNRTESTSTDMQNTQDFQSSKNIDTRSAIERSNQFAQTERDGINGPTTQFQNETESFGSASPAITHITPPTSYVIDRDRARADALMDRESLQLLLAMSKKSYNKGADLAELFKSVPDWLRFAHLVQAGYVEIIGESARTTEDAATDLSKLLSASRTYRERR